jgi:hypothetical protein
VTDENPPSQELSSELADAGLRIDKELRRKGEIAFSKAGAAALANAHSNFVGDLGVEAIRLTRKDRMSTVDRVHIETAVDHLGASSTTSLVANACNTIGGVVAGIGFAGAYALRFGSGPHSTTEILVTLALSVVGCILLAVGLTMTFAKR